MKKIFTLIAITFLTFSGLYAQSEATAKADEKFRKLEFVDAAKEYKKLVDDGKGNEYIYSRLGESYYNVFNSQEAEKWFYQALETSNDKEMMHKYIQMLKANGKYEYANEWMEKFAGLYPNDERAIEYLENPNYLPKIYEEGKKFRISGLSINSAYSDFGGTEKNGMLYITSARDVTGDVYGWNAEPYLDIYEMEIKADGSYGKPDEVRGKINTEYHEGLVSFSPDGNTMYFSRESYFEKEYKKDSISNTRFGLIHLYRATKDGKKWDNVESLSINNDNYSVKNPSVSPDGKTLYLASDKPGGYGGFDIYKVAINEDGSLGELVNLGPKVNTNSQDMFPFIGDDNTLFFSSNGHLGLGGLDVYYTQEENGSYTSVRNIGLPVNSNADDFAFRLNTETKHGFVSSNREGGRGSDDIFELNQLLSLCDVAITASVVDANTGDALAGASVALYDDQGNKLETKITNEEGVAEFTVECEKDYEIEVSLDGYESGKVLFNKTKEPRKDVKVMLDPIDNIVVDNMVELEPIFFEYDKSNITQKAAFVLDNLVQVMNKYPDMTIDVTAHTDHIGSDGYNEKLSDRRARTTVQYVISKGIDESRIDGRGMGEKMPKIKCAPDCTDEERQTNRRSEFEIVSGGPKSE